MAKKTTQTDEPEVEEAAPVEIPGGTAGNTGQAPMDPEDLLTPQEKIGRDEAAKAAKEAEKAAKEEEKAAKKAAKE